MKANAPTFTETKDAIIIRIPKAFIIRAPRRRMTERELLRVVARGTREFQHGKTEEFGTFLRRHYPSYARIFRRAR